jgi:hypothetical protein
MDTTGGEEGRVTFGYSQLHLMWWTAPVPGDESP